MDAITTAAPNLPDSRLLARLLLDALGVDDADELLTSMFNEDGTPTQAPPTPIVTTPQPRGNSPATQELPA